MKATCLLAFCFTYLSSWPCSSQHGKRRSIRDNLVTLPSFAKISGTRIRDSDGINDFDNDTTRSVHNEKKIQKMRKRIQRNDDTIVIGNGGEEESILVSPPSNNHLRKDIFLVLNVMGLLTLAYVVFVDSLQQWHEKFLPNLANNWFSISLVLSSKTVVITGLLTLCIFAIYCPEVYRLELFALGLLTAAPLLSICSILSWKNEPGSSIENKRGDLVSEFLEFIGMLLLDFSQVSDNRVSCLFIEVVGYTILLASAMLSFENVQLNSRCWGINLKMLDRMLIADILGNLSLVGFSVFLFHEKGVAERLRNRNIFQVIRDYVFNVPPSYYQGNNVIDYIFAG